MLFLHAWMLWLLPLAILPIVLHLLTLQRLKTVELPTFRFLFDSYVQQRRKLQFLEALLAMLRTLFLLGFILLVTRPVLSGWEGLFGGTGKGGGREVILLIDASASMNTKIDGLSAFERAKKAAAQLVERVSTEDQITLVRLTARPQEIFSRFNRDTRGILDQIRNLELSSSRANLFAALLQLFGPEGGQRKSPAVYLFTDSQSNTWREARDQGLDRLLPEGLPFTVVHVGPKTPGENVAVVGDAPRRNRALVGLPFLLNPRVMNTGKLDAEVVLSVSVDGKEVTRRPLVVKAGEVVTPTVTYRPTRAGLLRGQFQITGKSPDSFPDDDSYLFTLSAEPKVRVLVVNGAASPEPLLDEARYLVTALRSRADREDEKKELREALASLDVQEATQDRVTPELLRGASVVILANCGGLNALQFTYLQNFVREGGGLLVFPGDKVTDVNAYNNGLFTVAGPRNERLTDATLTPAIGDPDKAETFARLIPDLSHPALAVFDTDRAGDFRDVRAYRHFGLKLPEKGPKAQPLLSFNARGTPALVESRFGDGTLMLAAFPAHPRWGNLPLVPEFVPLLLRLVAHAEHRPEAEASAVVMADGPAEVSVSAAWDDPEVTIKTPTGTTLPPLPLERQGARRLGAFEKTAARGYYEVQARGSRPDGARALMLGFAVNLDPRESEARALDEAGVRKLLPESVKLTFIDATRADQEVQGELGSRTEIWPYLIWILFAVIGVEFLLATVSGRKREDEGPGVGERLASLGTGAWVGQMTGGDAPKE